MTQRAATTGDAAASGLNAGAIVKVSINLPKLELDELRELAERRQITVTAALREAIAAKVFLDEARASGSSILVRDNDGTLREVVFRP